MYEIILSDKAQKQLNKFDKKLQERIVSVLERIKFKPERHVQKLVGREEFKLRIGHYRAILEIDSKKQLIAVLKIGHRKNIYK